MDPLKENTPAVAGTDPVDDASTRALSDALRTSFGIIKLVMAALVVVFLFSGFRTVGTQEKAIKLRFGRPVSTGEGALLGPGLHWALPYPIDEVVRIPVSEVQIARSSVGWYATTAAAEAAGKEEPAGPSLNPARDGYLLTGDGNIIHARGTLRYRIKEPGIDYVFAFVSSSDAVRQAFDSSLVYAAAQFGVDDALTRNTAGFREKVQARMEQLIGLQGLGIVVDQISIQVIPPRQLAADFDAVHQEDVRWSKELNESRSYANETLNQGRSEAASRVNAGERERARMVEFVAADATNFLALLPAYERDPDLFFSQRHAQVMGRILTNAETKLLLPGDSTQLRLLLRKEKKKAPSSLMAAPPSRDGH